LQRTSRGRSIANLVQMLPNETHRAILPVKRFEENFVFFATAKGTVKKTPLNAFSNPRAAGIIAITLEPDDMLVGVEMTTGDDQVVLGSRDGMAVRFKETDVRAMGRTAGGVRGMTLEGDDKVVDLIAVPKPLAVSQEPSAEGQVPREDEALTKGSELMAKGYSVLTVCENGYGKRTDVDEYRLTKRGGKGVINIKTTERNGRVVALKAVKDTDGLMIITAKGIMLRTEVKELREIGRATQGVRLIRLDEGDTVVGVAKVAEEEGDEQVAESSPESSDPTGPHGESNNSSDPAAEADH
jgi:DNA gyrase subunit A